VGSTNKDISGNLNLTNKIYVIRRLTRSKIWETISHIDSNNLFRGQGFFSKKSEAQQYFKLFKECLKKHFSEQTGSGNRAHMNHKYQIFELDFMELNTLNKNRYAFSIFRIMLLYLNVYLFNQIYIKQKVTKPKVKESFNKNLIIIQNV
jgi:hypothetical protein